MEQRVSKLESKVQNLENRVSDVETMRSPDEVVARVGNMEEALDEIRTLIAELNVKVNAYINTDKYLEVFSNEEFKQLYMNSGLVAKDVAQIIKKKFPDIDVTAPSISRIINGERGSLELRSYLGKAFRYEIAKIK